MRTTINIDEHVLDRAKDDARAAGITLGEFIERALQTSATAPLVRQVPKLPSFGGKLLVPIDRMTNAEIQDFVDEDGPAERRR